MVFISLMCSGLSTAKCHPCVDCYFLGIFCLGSRRNDTSRGMYCSLSEEVMQSFQAIKDYFGTNQMWLVLGLMQGVKGLLSFLSAPLIGALSDTYGRRPFLLLTVGCTCLPLPFLFITNMWWHVSAVAFSGAFAVTFSVVFAYVSDVTDVADRSSAFGLVRHSTYIQTNWHACIHLCMRTFIHHIHIHTN